MKTLHLDDLDGDRSRWPEFMQRTLDLAVMVATATPNPRVGCVVVRDDEVVGEGWHVAAGDAHAEIVALEQAAARAQNATAFTSLEPCCHTGRTGACTTALLAAGIRQVVTAVADPNPQVAGEGIASLERAGVTVYQLADFEAAARAINRGYFKRLETGMPFLRIKLAMSLDGRTALASGASRWITGAAARADVQRYRAASSAILTGIGTVLSDNPRLNVRLEEIGAPGAEPAADRQPLRVVLDSRLRTPATARIIDAQGEVKLYTAAATSSHHEPPEAAQKLAANVDIRPVPGAASRGLDLVSVLESLASDFSCNDVLVEAGPILSGAFVEAGLADELIVYIAPKLLGSDARPLVESSGLQSLSESTEFSISDLTQVGTDIRVTLTPKAP